MAQSILEGIAFRAAEVLVAMNDCAPLKDILSIDGGLSANPYFCQFLVNILGKPVVVRKFSELTAYGTAQLASGGIERRFSNEQKTQYEPNANMSHYTARFKEAIDRATQWLA